MKKKTATAKTMPIAMPMEINSNSLALMVLAAAVDGHSARWDEAVARRQG